MIKIFSTADLHFCKETQEPFWESADFFLKKVRDEKPHLITIAGDTFHHPVYNTQSAGFTRFKNWIINLLDVAPIVTVYGTPTHDVPGCLDIFESIQAEHPYIVLRPGQPCFLQSGVQVGNDPEHCRNADIIIFGIPEPNKSWLLANNDLGSGQATEAVKGALKSLFLGMGAIRKKYFNIPCVVLYHGEISGATIGDWQKLPAGGISVGWRDLAMIGADYYSLGHIHDPQQVGDLPSYYEGSIFPVSWGELTQKQFHVVMLEGGHRVINTHHYPHPPRKKFEIRIGESVKFEEIKGFQIWLEISGSKEELRDFSEHKWKRILEIEGTLPGSRITTREIRTETTRAAEIVKQSNLFAKTKIWAENAQVDILLETEDRCDILETEIRQMGFDHKPRKLRLDHLQLRGTIGIWKGIGKEEIDIDFASLAPGTIALIGGNGSGKSTIIKNCNPYPDPIDDTRKQQDGFFLRDSHSKTYWTNTITGERYKAVKLINGRNVSGKTEFFFYQKNGDNWEPYNAEQTGRKEGYEKAVLEIFGSPEMFKRSAYIAQEGAELPKTPKGQKELFNELLGNQYLEMMSDSSKKKAKNIGDDLLTDAGKIEGLKHGLDRLPDLLMQQKQDNVKFLKAQEQIQVIEKEGQIVKIELEKLRGENENNERIAVEIRNFERDIEDNEHKKSVLQREVENLQATLERVPEAEAAIAENDKTKQQIEIFLVEKRKIEEENLSNRTAYQAALEYANAERRTIQARIQAVESMVANYDRLKKERLSKINSGYIETEAIRQPCEKCGYIKKDVQARIDEIEEMIVQQESDALSDNEVIEHYNHDLASLEKQLSQCIFPPEPGLLSFDNSPLQQAQEGLFDNSLEGVYKNILSEAVTGKAEISAKTSQIEEIKAVQVQKRENLDKKRSEYDLFLKKRLEDKLLKYDEKRADYTSMKTIIASLETAMQGIEKDIARIAEQKSEIARIENRLIGQKADLMGWEFMQRATGRNGIQALELDALTPSIAGVANNLLESSYGPRFEIYFETTKEVGKGKDAHIAEDFEVYISDHEEKRLYLQTQKLDTLSGGEKIWILKSLYDAFGIIREQNTGLQYMTAIQDEADGALEPEKKQLYLSMIEAAHAESGRYHTIYITHDLAIQETIQQKILMSELG